MDMNLVISYHKNMQIFTFFIDEAFKSVSYHQFNYLCCYIFHYPFYNLKLNFICVYLFVADFHNFSIEGLPFNFNNLQVLLRMNF